MNVRVFIPIVFLLGALQASAWAGSPPVHFGFNLQQREAGVYYRFGKITIDGAKAISNEEVLKIAGIKSNIFASPDLTDNAAERLKREYLNRGHARADVNVAVDYVVVSPRTKVGLAEVRINIHEGPVFLLRKLEFHGNQTTRDKIVRRKVLIDEGQPFSQQLLEKSLQGINSLKLFEKITMADVDLTLDDQQRYFDMVVHLKEVKRNK